MDFHLSFPITPFQQKINYSQKVLFLGSCFAENIGETMQQFKFNAQINPHGILYNPLSIGIALRRYIDNRAMQENELFFSNECWNSWEHHSRFSNPDKQSCLTEINKSIFRASEFLKNADWLFITFGSSFVYKHNETEQLVSNRHKISQKEFSKQLLTGDEIIADYKRIFQQLKKINNKLKIVFTVSPLRYIRDGVVENNLSKARLIESIHQLVKDCDNAFYFPAYELVIDDLRDYRFYKKDMVHPNEQAISYVFEKLMDTAFDEETKLLFEKIKDIITAKQHRPFYTNIDAYQQFKVNFLQRSKQLQKEYPFLNLQDELNAFE